MLFLNNYLKLNFNKIQGCTLIFSGIASGIAKNKENERCSNISFILNIRKRFLHCIYQIIFYTKEQNFLVAVQYNA